MKRNMFMLLTSTKGLLTAVLFVLLTSATIAQQPETIKLSDEDVARFQNGQSPSMSAVKPVVAPLPQGGTIGTVVTLTGFMLNGNTLTPVEANYALYENGKKVGQSHKSNANDGFLVTGLKPGGEYMLKIEDPRYFRQEFPITLPKTAKYAEISKDFIVRPMEAGRKISVVPPPFDLRKNVVKSGVEEDIKGLAQMLSSNPSVNVELVCYPDEDGTAATASSMSTARGNALKAAFEANGVQGSRITVKTVNTVDPINPPPLKKGAKGKRYVGSVYIVVTKV